MWRVLSFHAHSQALCPQSGHGERHCQLYHDDVCNLATFQLSEPKIQDYSGYFILEIIVLLGQYPQSIGSTLCFG